MKTFVLPRRRSQITLDITMQSAYEELLGTPVDLPTSEPGTAQYEWTVISGDLPAFSQTMKSVVYVGYFLAAGKNVSGASRTVYYRMVKNGGSVVTGSSAVANATFYTWNCYFYGIAVDDVLGIKLWASDVDVNRDYQAYQVQPSRPFLQIPDAELMKPLNFAAVSNHPVLAQGAPSSDNRNYRYLPPNQAAGIGTQTALVIQESRHHSTYGLFTLDYGDFTVPNTGVVRVHASYRPYFYRTFIPTKTIVRSYGELT